MKTKILLLAALLLASISCKKDKPLTAPQAGLISYFNFDNNLQDQNAYANNGTGTYDYVNGKIGGAVHFNGQNQSIQLTPKKVSKTNSALTVSAWINSDVSNTGAIFCSTDNFNLFATAGAKLVGLTIITQNGGTTASSSLIPGQWVHVVGTYDGAAVKVYTDGELKSTQPKTGTIFIFNGLLNMGEFGGAYWSGSIDELRIYDRALSQAEVTQLYNLK